MSEDQKTVITSELGEADATDNIDKTPVRGSRGKFAPGNKSGGRKAMPKQLQAKIRKACPDAVALWISLIKDPTAKPDHRLKAAEALMAYGYGKPVQSLEADVTADVSAAPATIKFEGVLEEWSK